MIYNSFGDSLKRLERKLSEARLKMFVLFLIAEIPIRCTNTH